MTEPVLLMAYVRLHRGTCSIHIEAEPVLVSLDGLNVRLELDGGLLVSLDAVELLASVQKLMAVRLAEVA